MRNTRAHAPITEVLDAAGVPTYTPRALSNNDEDLWTRHPPRSLERTQTRRERRRQCKEPGWCDVETPYDAGSSEGGSWESREREREQQRDNRGRSTVRDAAEDADTEEDRRVTLRRVNQAKLRANGNNAKMGPRSYRIANPDSDRTRPHRSNSDNKYDLWQPQAQRASTDRSTEQDDAYMLTQEVLAYSFGGKPR